VSTGMAHSAASVGRPSLLTFRVSRVAVSISGGLRTSVWLTVLVALHIVGFPGQILFRGDFWNTTGRKAFHDPRC